MTYEQKLGFVILSFFIFHFSFLHAQTDSIAVDSLPQSVPDTALVLPLDSLPAATPHQASPKRPSVYQGVTVKLDLGAAVLAMAVSKARIQQWEVAANVRLKNRFYPTFELGYAGGAATRGDSLSYNGHGGFFRVGCDICPLKKRPESPHALLVGVRLGTAVQGARQGATADTWRPYKTKADCWGEIVLGCQVNVVKGLYMGWMGRLKFLFTRDKDGLAMAEMAPVYIPGYGNRGDMSYGLSYHIGWHF